MSKKTSKKTSKPRKKSPAASLPPVPTMKKSAYIRTFDTSVPAKEVVAQGAAAGYELTEQAVYSTRLGDRKRAAKGGSFGVPEQGNAEANHPGISRPSQALQAVSAISSILSGFDAPTSQRILATVSNLAQLS